VAMEPVMRGISDFVRSASDAAETAKTKPEAACESESCGGVGSAG
jgi:hypothetical protein